MTRMFFAVALCAMPVLAADAEGPAALAGRSLRDAIAVLSRQGLRIVYSDELVREEMRVAEEPKVPSPRERLAAILEPHGLALKDGPRRGLTIVRNDKEAGKPR